MTGAELIAAERNRQIKEEGWTAERDDGHTDERLAVVAASLAVDGTDTRVEDPFGRGTPRVVKRYAEPTIGDINGAPSVVHGDCWGLVRKHRHDRERQLVIAGALIAAEIDRLLRMKEDDSDG